MQEESSFRVSPQQEQLWAEEPDGPTGALQAVVESRGRSTRRRSRLRSSASSTPRDPADDLRPPARHPRAAAGDQRLARAAVGDARPQRQRRGRACDAPRRRARGRAPPACATSSTARSCTGCSSTSATGPSVFALTVSLALRRRRFGSGDARGARRVRVRRRRGRRAAPVRRFLGMAARAAAPTTTAERGEGFWQRALDAPAVAHRSRRTRRRRPSADEIVVPVDEALGASASPSSPLATARAPPLLVHAAWHAFLSRVDGAGRPGRPDARRNAAASRISRARSV